MAWTHCIVDVEDATAGSVRSECISARSREQVVHPLYTPHTVHWEFLLPSNTPFQMFPDQTRFTGQVGGPVTRGKFSFPLVIFVGHSTQSEAMQRRYAGSYGTPHTVWSRCNLWWSCPCCLPCCLVTNAKKSVCVGCASFNLGLPASSIQYNQMELICKSIDCSRLHRTNKPLSDENRSTKGEHQTTECECVHAGAMTFFFPLHICHMRTPAQETRNQRIPKDGSGYSAQVSIG